MMAFKFSIFQNFVILYNEGVLFLFSENWISYLNVFKSLEKYILYYICIIYMYVYI